MTAVDGEACAVVATAADIICSLRGADLAGWTPPWRKHEPAHDKEEGAGGGDDARELAWPAVARGKRSRSSRRESPSASGSAASADATKLKKKKKARRGARGSPASPLDYSGGSGSGSGSGASTSGGEDGAFCSQPEPPPAAFPPVAEAAAAVCYQQLAPPAAPAPPPPTSKVGGVAGRRTILPVPVPPPGPAGQRARKKMRLPEIQQMVRSLSVENDALRKEMKALQRACTVLSQENGKLETRLDQSISMDNKGKKPQPEHQHTVEQEAPSGFVLPDLNLPADV